MHQIEWISEGISIYNDSFVNRIAAVHHNYYSNVYPSVQVTLIDYFSLKLQFWVKIGYLIFHSKNISISKNPLCNCSMKKKKLLRSDRIA